MRCRRECERVDEFPLFPERYGGFAEAPYLCLPKIPGSFFLGGGRRRDEDIKIKVHSHIFMRFLFLCSLFNNFAFTMNRH